MPSKVANDPEEPSVGRIRADFIAPPHSPTSIKLCISRVERNPGIVNSDLFADPSCDSPLKEGHILIHPTDGPGLSPKEPIAIVQADVQVELTSIPNGKYLIKNRRKDIYWGAGHSPLRTVYFYPTITKRAKKYPYMQVNEYSPIFQVLQRDNSLSKWDITQDANGNISIISLAPPSSWVGAEIKGSSVPVSWRLIPADSKSY